MQKNFSCHGSYLLRIRSAKCYAKHLSKHLSISVIRVEFLELRVKPVAKLSLNDTT